MWVAALLTVISGAQYCLDAFPLLLERDSQQAAG
jgi:hypothetical protein